MCFLTQMKAAGRFAMRCQRNCDSWSFKIQGVGRNNLVTCACELAPACRLSCQHHHHQHLCTSPTPRNNNMSLAFKSSCSAGSARVASSKSSKRYASFRPAVSTHAALPQRDAQAAVGQDVASSAAAIDRRSMLAFSAVLPLMLQQSAQADDGEHPSCDRAADLASWCLNPQQTGSQIIF